jgi:hypothetical protein
MSCPHGSSVGASLCPACIAQRLAAQQWKLRDVAASIARCDHRRVHLEAHIREDHTTAIAWCGDCGALRVNGHAWSLPRSARYAKEVDDEMTLWDQPHGPPPGDSEPKNVIPMKPRR